MLIESLQPLRVRRKADVVDLLPGLPVEFDEAEGQLLLRRMPGKVKVVGGDSGGLSGLFGLFCPTSTHSPLDTETKKGGAHVGHSTKESEESQESGYPQPTVLQPGTAPAFQVGSVVRVNSQSGVPWIGSVGHSIFEPVGGPLKSGWWYGIEAGKRWSFVHEPLLDTSTRELHRPD